MEVDMDLRFVRVRARVILILVDVVVSGLLELLDEDVERFRPCPTCDDISTEQFTGS